MPKSINVIKIHNQVNKSKHKEHQNVLVRDRFQKDLTHLILQNKKKNSFSLKGFVKMSTNYKMVFGRIYSTTIATKNKNSLVA